MFKKKHINHQKNAIQSSFTVAVFTALGFLGFFIRDYLMAKNFGFASVLDEFYLVTMLPMFLVSIFCIPFGQAIIPKLKKLQRFNNERFFVGAKYLSFLALFFCIFLCLLNYFLSNATFHFLNYFGWIKINNNIDLIQLTYLPILFFSGLIILCNSILFVRERYVYPSVAQIIVPISAILFLIAFGKSMGVFAVILGMVFGQFINFMLVYFALKKDNIQIFPFAFDFKMPSSFWIGYGHLIIIAIFTASLTLINTYISTSLGSGAVSIFNLGTKFSMFLIGILTAMFSSVLLPYLSKLYVYQENELLKKETYILILISTFIFMPFSMMTYLSAEWISDLIFSYIVFDHSAILGIASVIKYSFIQLPFWVFNAILFRHANAINKIGIITTSSLLLFTLDLFFSFNLIEYMNVGGLALSMTLSTAITSCFILFFYIYKKYFNLIEGFFLLASWIFFGSILLKINFVRLLDLFNKAI